MDFLSTQNPQPPPGTTTDPTTTAAATSISPLHTVLPLLTHSLTPTPPDPPLPAPNQFDFLPPLHALISKVHTDELDPKDLSHHANPIRVKLAKARQLVLDLPDITKGLDAQKEEIRELEERIEKQRKVIQEALDVVKRQMGGNGGFNGATYGREGGSVKMEMDD